MKFLNTISITPKLLMTSNNLALMFSPNLYPPELYNTIRKATRQKSGNLKVEVVRHMIDYYAYVFGETNELPTFKVNQQENKEEDEEEVVTEMNKTVSDPLGTQENTIKAFDSTEELANQKEEKPKENHSVEEPKVNDIEEKPNTQE